MLESNHDDSFQLVVGGRGRVEGGHSNSVFTKRNMGLMARLSLFVVAFVCVCLLPCICACLLVLPLWTDPGIFSGSSTAAGLSKHRDWQSAG